MQPSSKSSASIFIAILLLSLFCTKQRCDAQQDKIQPNDRLIELKTSRVLFLVDGSSSMRKSWIGDKTRFSKAKEMVYKIADSVEQENDLVEFALRVFGHKYPAIKNYCYDSRLEVGFSGKNSQQINTRLSYVYPQGVSPIAWSLKESAEVDFVQNDKYAYSIILITDGGESCEGDICATMKNLVNKKIHFQPYIISLIDNPKLKRQYDCMGKYMVAQNDQQFKSVLDTIISDTKSFVADQSTKYTPKPLPEIKLPEWYFKSNLPQFDTNRFKVTKITPKDTTSEEDKLPKDIKMKLNYAPVIGWNKVPFTRVVRSKIELIPIRLLPRISYEASPAQQQGQIRALKPLTDYKKIKVQLQWSKSAALRIPKLDNITLDTPTTTPKPVEPDTPAVPKKTVTLKKTAINSIVLNIRPKRANYLFSIPTSKILRVPPIDKIKIYETDLTVAKPKQPKPKSKPTAPPTDTTKASASKPKVTSEAKSDPEALGTLQFYITNGKGKNYTRQPLYRIYDLKTNSVIYTGARKVAANGNPIPLQLQDGTYKAELIKSKRSVNFSIKKGTNTKAELIVSQGSLSFRYRDSDDVPKGFTAVVSKRFEEGDLTRQPTDKIYKYEPSNYHIEVNTLPPSIFNVDLEYSYETQITLRKAGTLQIMNTNEMGRVDIYYQQGISYLRFLEMNIIGSPEEQKQELRAGPFKVKYVIRDTEGKPALKSKKVIIYPGQVAQITLD